MYFILGIIFFACAFGWAKAVDDREHERRHAEQLERENNRLKTTVEHMKYD